MKKYPHYKSYKATVQGEYLGQIKRGCEIGYKGIGRWIWHACERCGFERWVVIRKGETPANKFCKHCSPRNVAEKNGQWRGGRTGINGYIHIWVASDDFFHAMADKKHYVMEHRLVMARYLKRCLFPWEIVHHKNGIKDDNRIENLELLPDKRFHIIDATLKGRIAKLEKRVLELETENILLEKRLRELTEEINVAG